jgi:hypothetical protein
VTHKLGKPNKSAGSCSHNSFLHFPGNAFRWPIRQILFVSPEIGWAAGGNVYSAVGGIYFSRDGGQIWSLDVTTNAEMDACDSKRSGAHLQVWCAGTDSNFNGVVYGLSK